MFDLMLDNEHPANKNHEWRQSSKTKGNRVERECVNLAKEFGFNSRRAWGLMVGHLDGMKK